jgi:AcrR family transcriptional regulator
VATKVNKVKRAAKASRIDTRAELVAAAEQLFAAHGIEGVSLREINRVAGAANAGALHYHFGDRAGLLRAVIDKHRADTETRRHILLDQYDAAPGPDLRGLSSALILPLVAKLDDPSGGREYLQINCEIYTRPDFDKVAELLPPRDPRSSIRRWHERLDLALPPEEDALLRTRFAAMRFAFVELARRATSKPRDDDQLFASHLVDLMTALLATPPSQPTHLLLAPRP